MKDIDLMIKSRALFLYTVGMIREGRIRVDDEFNYIYNNFISDNLDDYFELFNLIMYFVNDENGDLCFYEEDSWNYKLIEYLQYFNLSNSRKIIELYDDLGSDRVNRINELARLFCEYVDSIKKIKVFEIKQ